MSVPILRRDELLDFAKISAILKQTDIKNELKVIDELKQQCSSNNISKRDFDALLKIIKSEIIKPEIVIDSECLPKCIQNTGDEYTITDNGIFLISGKFTNEVCPHPIFPVEILQDVDTGEEKIRIAFKRKGIWKHDIIVDRYDIATTKGIVKLSNYGILVNDENARYLVKFFCDIEKLNENNIKPKFATGTLGYSKHGFIPYSTDIIYNCSNNENKRRFSLYSTKGEQSIWKTKQIEIMAHIVPKIAIAGGYASLLVEKIGINPFGIHLWGETGLGKSVALLSSASIYGYPDIKNGIVYTGNATANGLEPRLAFVKNCAFYLDELSMLSAKQIDDMIYLIMQGQGKARMSRAGNTKDTYYWNLVSISNAEMPITNDLSKGGTYNRIIQVGATEKIFGDLNLPDIAETFKNNYGFGAKIFIDLLNQEEILTEIKQLKKQYYNEVILHTEDKQANAAACILTAFEIARKYIYETDIKLTASEIIPYLHTPDEISQVLRAYNKLCDYIQANYKMFDNTDIGQFQQKWGSTNSNNTETHIYPFKFSEFCNSININEKQFLTGLKQHDLIKTSKGENYNRVKIDNKTQRMITVKKSWLDSVTGQPVTTTRNQQDFEEIQDDELPF